MKTVETLECFMKNDQFKRISTSPDVVLAVLFLVVPMIMYLSHMLHGLVFTIPVFCLWLLVITIDRPVFFKFIKALNERRNEFIFLLIFLLIVAINSFISSPNSTSFQYFSVFLNIFLILVLDTYYGVRDVKYRNAILCYILIALGIQASISIPYFLSEPGYIARALTSGKIEGEESVEAMKKGIGHSAFYLSLIPLIFLGMGKWKRYNLLMKVLIIISLISIAISIFLSSFFTPIVMIILALLVYLYRYRLKVINTKTIIIGGLVFILGFYFYNEYIASTNILKPMSIRLNGVLTGEGTSIDSRERLSSSSLETFSDNPFLGIGIAPRRSYDLVGGHNMWIDFLAYFGVLGYLPFLVFFGLLLKKNIQRLLKPKHDFYKNACLVGIIVFIFSNFGTPSITNSSMLVMLFFFALSYSNYNKLNSR